MISFKQFSVITICETADSGLAAKAKKSGVSIGTLRKVYKRGVAAWNSGHRPGTTPQQWGMARVNSYITKGKGTYHGADKDLREEVDAVESLTSSLSDPSSYDAIDQMMQTIAKDSGISPKELHDNFVKKHGKTPDDYAKSVQEAVVPKDKESGLPKKYVAGLSPSTAKARAAHFSAADKLSDSDPRAYKPAPGDATAKTKESEHTKKYRAMFGEDMDEELYEACWDTHKQVGMKKKGNRMVPDCVPKNEESIKESGGEVVYRKGDNHIEQYNDHSFAVYLNGKKQTFFKSLDDAKTSLATMDEQFDLIEAYVEELALNNNIDPETLWEKLESISDEELLEAAVDAKGHKSSTGGLTQKGRDAYNAKGANLKPPVTTPPSKLKAGSKAANRRKSFCARMGGMEGPMKKPNGEPTRKALALRKWNC
jgi:hypothetical protein